MKKKAFILAEGRLACSTTLESAKEVQSMLAHTLAPCGRGQNLLANECELRNSGEGACKSDKTDMTPHQVGTKLAKRSLSPTILSPKGEEFHDRARHEAAEPASCNSLVPQFLSNLVPSFAPSVRKSANVFINSLVPLAANNKSFYIRKSRSVWGAQFLPAE